jgi:hypothetical protein
MWINRRWPKPPASGPVSARRAIGRTQAAGPTDPPTWRRQANVFLALAKLSDPTWSCRHNLVREIIDIAQRCTDDTLF